MLAELGEEVARGDMARKNRKGELRASDRKKVII
jgi:hypothetical protein